MEITVSNKENHKIIIIKGDITLQNYETFIIQMKNFIFSNNLNPNVIVDMTGVNFIDAAGIKAIITIGKWHQKKFSKNLLLSKVPYKIQKLLNIINSRNISYSSQYFD